MTRQSFSPEASARAITGTTIVLLVASVAVLSVALPIALVAGVPDVERSAAWPVTLLITVWGGVRLSVLWARGVPLLFDFFFWLFTYIFMGIAPTVQMRSGDTSRTTPGVDAGLDMPTALIVLLGVAIYEVSRLGWWLIRRRQARHDSYGSVSTARALILMGIGLLFSFYFIYRIGVGPALGSREAAFAARAAAWPDAPVRAVFYALATYPLLVAIGALAQVRHDAHNAVWKWALTACMGIGLVTLVTVVNPISSARYTFGTVAFALVVYAGALRTRFRVRITLLSTIVAFLFIFPIADAFRRTEVRVGRSGFFEEYRGNPDYDSFWQIANALSYWVDGLVEPGRQLMGSLLFWVPRSVWGDKPVDTGIMLAQYRGYSFENLSAPAWAEMLVNGGVVAVVLGFLVLGPFLATMDARMRLVFFANGWWAITGAVLPVYMTILLRGSLLQATGTLVVSIACLIWVRQVPARTPAPIPQRSLPYSVGSSRTRDPGGPSPLPRRDPTRADRRQG